MGGATTLVEARVLGRVGVGIDINSLSCFIARAKTTHWSDADIRAVQKWTVETARFINMRTPTKRATSWLELGYQRNINTRQTWAIRKSLELALSRIPRLQLSERQVFARAIVLRTAQWALDCRTDVPSVDQFRKSLLTFLEEMAEGATEFREAIDSCKVNPGSAPPNVAIFNRAVDGVDTDPQVRALGVPRLILTSPPYPGMHVLYHRWQVLGRRETPAPYWIANSLDGSGLSYYTFGDRKNPGLKSYFDNARASFGSLARLAGPQTLFVQMLAFSDPSWQLPLYLETMRSAGLEEIPTPELSNAHDGRLWRAVPNRKWYADQRGGGGGGTEVVLFHRKSKR